MSIFGALFFMTLFYILSLIVNDKPKIAFLLFVLYSILSPFMLIFSPLHLPATFALLVCLLAIFIIYILLTKMKKFENNSILLFFKSKRIKIIMTLILFTVMLYLEAFNGIESFENSTKFFEFKREIGFGHILPYALNSKKYYESGNVASYIILPFYGYELYLYHGELYYYPISNNNYPFHDGEPPDQYWVKWKHKYNYRPD